MVRILSLVLAVALGACSNAGSECTGLCSFQVDGFCYNLSTFTALTLSGPQANGGGGHYNVSLCGNLTNPCIDSLTRVPIFGYLYTFFGDSRIQQQTLRGSHCWDVLSKFVHTCTTDTLSHARTHTHTHTHSHLLSHIESRTHKVECT